MRAARRPLRGGERGFTLIDTLVGMAVMATGVVGIMFGFSAAETSAAVSTDQARLQSEMRQLSDFVRSRDSLAYIQCAVESSTHKDYTPHVNMTWTSGDTWTMSVGVGTSATRNGAAVQAWLDCPAVAGVRPAGGDWNVQEITLTVSSASRSCSGSPCSLTRVVWKGAA